MTAPSIENVSAAELKGQSVRGAIVTAISQGIKFTLSTVSQIALARLLIPADFGLLAMVSPVVGLIGLFADLGLLQAIIQSPQVSREQLNSLFWLNVLASSILGFVALASAPVTAAIYHEPKLLPITSLLAIPLFLSGLNMVHMSLLNRMMRFSTIATIDATTTTFGAIVTVIFAYLGLGVWALALGQVTISLLNCALAWIASPWRPNRPQIGREIAGMLKSGVHVSGANLAGYLSSSFDNFLVGIVRGKVELGYYDRAYRLVVQPLAQLQAPFGRVAVPLLSRLVSDSARYRSAYERITEAMLLGTTPGLVTVCLASKLITETLLGHKWLPAAPVISWICFGAIISPVNSTLFWLLQSQGRTSEQLKWGGGIMMFNVLTYIIGIPWGVVGVARTSALSVYLIQTPLLVWAVSKSGPVDRKVITRPLVLLAPATIATGSSLWAAMRWIREPGIGHILEAFALSYAVFLLVIMLSRSGRKSLRAVWLMRKEVLNRKSGSVQT